MGMHPKRLIHHRVRDGLPELIRDWQKENPDCLLPTGFITRAASEYLDVSRAAVCKHLTEAVSQGRLIEVLMRRDRLVMLPPEAKLPPLYAVRDEDVYVLMTRAPLVRGSDGVSFLVTPSGFTEFIGLQQAKYETVVPSMRSV